MANSILEQAFQVNSLDVDRLLADWRWLCPDAVSLVASNAFGDLFLRNEKGAILWLQVSIGEISEIAASEHEFRELLKVNQEEWLAEADAQCAAERGLVPADAQCIGFKIPVVFVKSASTPNNPYIADLYEYVSFLGCLHKQIRDCPDGTRVRLEVVD